MRIASEDEFAMMIPPIERKGSIAEIGCSFLVMLRMVTCILAGKREVDRVREEVQKVGARNSELDDQRLRIGLWEGRVPDG